MAKKLLRDGPLEKRAEELGVSSHELYGSRSEGRGGPTTLDEPELQRRVMEAERSIREGRLWMVALVSAIAAAISAVAAWCAVVCK